MISRFSFLIALLLLIWRLCAPGGVFAADSALRLRIFDVSSRAPSELIPIVLPLLSPSGRVAADDRTRKLLVYEKDVSRFAAVEALLKEVDVPPVNIRIETRSIDE